MPKILEGVRERAIEAARAFIVEKGYDAMTVRLISRQLEIGLGTLYNYFPSKEHLAAAVMLEDWDQAVEQYRGHGPFDSPLAAVEGLFDSIRAFSERFRFSWEQYAKHRSAQIMRQQYRGRLVDQLSDALAPRIPAELTEDQPSLLWFLAEICLRFGSERNTKFDDLRPLIARLLNKGET